jgi:hypothetical protein
MNSDLIHHVQLGCIACHTTRIGYFLTYCTRIYAGLSSEIGPSLRLNILSLCTSHDCEKLQTRPPGYSRCFQNWPFSTVCAMNFVESTIWVITAGWVCYNVLHQNRLLGRVPVLSFTRKGDQRIYTYNDSKFTRTTVKRWLLMNANSCAGTCLQSRYLAMGIQVTVFPEYTGITKFLPNSLFYYYQYYYLTSLYNHRSNLKFAVQCWCRLINKNITWSVFRLTRILCCTVTPALQNIKASL